jgi:sugar O-acyltransferase (sialic acid O-acetyltransferase NeuD family)
MKNIIIVGAGGFGREVYQWALDSFDEKEYKIKGFLSNNKKDLDGFDIPCKVIGNEDNYNIEDEDRFVIAIGNVDIKRRVIKKLKDKKAKFVNLIHPTSKVSNSKMGEGIIICPYCIVTDSSVINDFVTLNVYSCCAHDAKIGKYSILSPYSTLTGGSSVGKSVFMATRATIAPNKNVGDNSVVGAHSLVLNDVPCDSKVLGISKKAQKE